MRSNNCRILTLDYDLENIFNEDFKDFIRALNDNDVEYLLVGGYAVILHGYNRTTGDLDIWVNPTEANYKTLTTALHSFGIPSSSIPLRAFLNENDFDVFTFGRPPIAIDIMTKVKGLEFNSCFKKAMFYETEGIEIKLIHYQSLILAKQAAGRYKDLNDIEKLEEE